MINAQSVNSLGFDCAHNLSDQSISGLVFQLKTSKYIVVSVFHCITQIEIWIIHSNHESNGYLSLYDENRANIANLVLFYCISQIFARFLTHSLRTDWTDWKRRGRNSERERERNKLERAQVAIRIKSRARLSSDDEGGGARWTNTHTHS